jgi:hypothetical protein
MRNVILPAVVLIAVISACAMAQQLPTTEEVLKQPTAVIILKDGEQLVIRGGYEVRDGLVLFFLEQGGHPVYSSINQDTVDFDATDSANKHLREERERQRRYWELIEQRRRRLLEEVQNRPVVVNTQAGVRVGEEQRPGAAGREEQQQFPAYDTNRLRNEPEAWWRDEAARLFTALEASNARMAEMERRQDDLVMRINRARSEQAAKPMQQELARLRQDLLHERESARLIGNRLTDLSIAAEEFGLPLDWLLPAGSAVVDEGAAPPPDQAAAAQPDQEIPSYDIDNLRAAEDSWWAPERQRLEEIIQFSRDRLAALRERYNLVIAERDGEQSEARRIMLNDQIKALEGSIAMENDRLGSARAAYDELFRIARELGKEEALGLMKERQEP